MWPFRKRERPDPPGVIEARAAEARAERAIKVIELRTGEVDTYYANLSERRKQNNFGAALQAAMGPHHL
jgi:hypothetical protein